jgi:hypothetical protein
MVTVGKIWSLVLAVLCWGSWLPISAKDDPEIQFVQNKNQWRKPVLYKAASPMADIFLLPDRIQYVIRKEESEHGQINRTRKIYEGGPHSKSQWIASQLFEVTFLNANKKPIIETEDPAVTLYNFFIGNDSSRWASKARGFGTIYYRQLYPHTDLKIYSENGKVKQDWIVSPEGDPYRIRINYDGAESVYMKDGNLIVSTRAGELTELKPYAYQIVNGQKITVQCNYRLKRNTLSYSLPDGYDVSLPLIIDPILVFSGYSGSTYDNWGNTATYDSHGNLYSGGMITTDYFGTDFPATPGSYKTSFIGGEWDIGILKYDSSGSALYYATYVGGNGTESPHSLVVDQTGNLLILGATSSTDFPVSNGSKFKGGTTGQPILGTTYTGGSDIYVARLSEDGSKLINATYLGGSKNDGMNWIDGDGVFDNPGPLVKNYGDETRGDIITDKDNFVYLASNSRSPDMVIVNPDPTALYHGGSHDAVVFKLSADLSTVIWNRFLGGDSTDVAYSLKLGPANDVYVAGGTASTDFSGMNGLHSTAPGNIDGWVAHISPAGDAIMNATYLGTPSYDQAYFIDLNSANEVFVYGQTQGPYPVQGNVYTNPHSGQFIHKLSSDLTTSIFSTVVGTGSGSPDISPTAFLVSDCGQIYISGWGGLLNQDYEHYYYVGGSTFNLPITPNAYQPITSGNDFYFMVLSLDATTFLYGTFLGGKVSLTHVDGGTSRFDKSGIVYHAVCASCGGHYNDFPAVNVPPARNHNGSRNCNNAGFKFDLSLLRAVVQTNSDRLNEPGLTTVCLKDTIVFQNKSIGGQVFQWNLGDGATFSKTDTSLIYHVYLKTGTYKVKLKAIDAGTCRSVDSTFVQVKVVAPMGVAGSSQTICGGSSAVLTAKGGTIYAWKGANGTFQSSDAQVTVSPTDSTLYFVTIKDVNNCIVKDTLDIGVIPDIPVDLTVTRNFSCTTRPTIEVKNITKSDDSGIFIDFGDGTITDKKDDIHVYAKDSTYLVKIVGKSSFCSFEKSVSVPIYSVFIPNVITPVDSPGQNDQFTILYGNKRTQDAGINVNLTVSNRWGKTVYRNPDYQGDWGGENVNGEIYYYDVVINNEINCRSWLQIIK